MSVAAGKNVQSVGPLVGLPAVLAEHGVSVATVLEGTGLRESDLKPETQVSIGVISRILERAAELTGSTEIGLLVGRYANHMMLGPVGQLMMSCETLGSALGTFAALQITNSTAAAAYLHPVGEDYALGFGVYAPELASSHVYDVAAATGFNMVRDLTGGAVRPAEFLLSRPVPANPEAYRRFFRCPVRFNEAQTCMILRGRDMGFRLPTANAARREGLFLALQRQLAQDPKAVTARVKHALRPLLLAGAASHRQVAAHLNIHPRTMGRRLEEEGVTFEQLKDEVRQVVARELLLQTEVAISDVAATLGYSTPSAFVRAFRRWTEASPSAWRRAGRSEGL